MITKRQPRRQWHRETLAGPFPRRSQSTGTLFSAFKLTSPDDFPTPGGQAQSKFGMSRLGMDDVHRTQSQWRIPFPIGQLLPREHRVGEKTKSTDQRQQCLVGDFVALTERVRVISCNAKEPGEFYDCSSVVHVRQAYGGVPASAGSSALEGTTLDANAGLRGNSCRGARLMNSANEWACNR